MTTGDVFTIVFIILGLLLSLPSLWLLLGLLLPGLVARAGEHARARPVAVFFTGVGVTALVTFAATALGKAGGGPGQLLNLIVVLAAVGVAMIGVAGLTRELGARLRLPDAGEPAWREQMRGATILALAMLVPFLGWFVVLPIVVLLGIGSAVLAMLVRSSTGKPPVPAEPAAVEHEATVEVGVPEEVAG